MPVEYNALSTNISVQPLTILTSYKFNDISAFEGRGTKTGNLFIPEKGFFDRNLTISL